jgi:hypothetical protein
VGASARGGGAVCGVGFVDGGVCAARGCGVCGVARLAEAFRAAAAQEDFAFDHFVRLAVLEIDGPLWMSLVA